LQIPVHVNLAEIIGETPADNLTFLTTKFGEPFTAPGFGNWFRDRCNEAGLPYCCAHGLRKPPRAGWPKPAARSTRLRRSPATPACEKSFATPRRQIRDAWPVRRSTR
jgi:hypothetical protein